MSPGVRLQHLVPQKLLSRLVMAATRWRLRPWKDLLIRSIAGIYRIDVAEAASAQLGDYPHFNAFFTRALKPGARPLDADPAQRADACRRAQSASSARSRPARSSRPRAIRTAATALLGDETAAAPFHDGVSPPSTCRRATTTGCTCRWPAACGRPVHVPGQLFSVSPATVAEVPGLFARNERLVCLFDTDHGPMAVVLVGAMLVSGVETVWGGVEIPPYAKNIVTAQIPAAVEPAGGPGARRGAWSRFNMGSTVILLLPKGFSLESTLGAGTPVRMGQRLGRLPGGA